MASTTIAQMVNWHDNVRYSKQILIRYQSLFKNIYPYLILSSTWRFGYHILLRNSIPLQWIYEIPEQKDFKLGEIRNWYICYSLVAPPNIQKYERDKLWLRCYHDVRFSSNKTFL